MEHIKCCAKNCITNKDVFPDYITACTSIFVARDQSKILELDRDEIRKFIYNYVNMHVISFSGLDGYAKIRWELPNPNKQKG